MTASTSSGRVFLALECAFLFAALPLLLTFFPTTRGEKAFGLWGVAAYGALILTRMPGFSWRVEWRGVPLSAYEFLLIAARLAASTLGIVLLTRLLMPERILSFPLQRPGMWLIVMLLYPLLSALPQELLFRSFFFRRYAPLFPGNWMLAASAAAFGFVHIMFHNAVAPLLSALCGFFLASSYQRHASLGRVALEHALYGDMVFTIGLGVYFIFGHLHN